MAITIKEREGSDYPIFKGSKEMQDYFDPYIMESKRDDLNELICYSCPGGDWRVTEEMLWCCMPEERDYTKKDWKIIVAGFKHFGIDLLPSFRKVDWKQHYGL